ncbi:MAG: Hsp33 family molecular chaperone HslO [Oscillospiraceae bacterium]|nr:Hsp33 family molecular chaperone HslO [Oscillospiraceae bacterium]
MKDQILRGTAGGGAIRFSAITGRTLVQRAREIHNTSPVASAALGRTLLAASLLGNDLKTEGNSLTIRINGGGPLGSIVVVSDENGWVRGYCQRPLLDLPLRPDGKLDVAAAVGVGGSLTVIKDIGLKDPYVGQIELRSGEIAEDITAYLAESEQVPSACALGVLVDRDYSIKRAGGYIISLLPGVKEETITQLEICIARAKPVTTYLDQGYTLREMMEQVLSGFDCNFLSEEEVGYRCTCSRERVREVLLSLGREELERLHREQDTAEVNCQFCDEVYRFTYDDIEDLLKEANA